MQAIADRQNGVITTAQLHTIGFSESGVSGRVRLGRLHRVHRAVYAVGRRELSQAGRFHAAVLAIGDGAVLSHLAAAVLGAFGRPSRA
jgi:hypothetical protein